MTDSTNMPAITNRDEIVGLPAMVVRQFLIDCEPESLDKYQLGANLSLSDDLAKATFDDMVTDGYFELAMRDNQMIGYVKTPKALDLIDKRTPEPINREESMEIVQKLFAEIDALKLIPGAYQFQQLSFFGAFINSPVTDLPFIEVSIDVLPYLTEAAIANNSDMLNEWEKIAADAVELSGINFTEDLDRRNWSLKLLKDQICRVSPHLCVRFG